MAVVSSWHMSKLSCLQWCLSHGKLCRLTSVIIMIDEREELIMQLCSAGVNYYVPSIFL